MTSIGIIVGSIAQDSINKQVAEGMLSLAPEGVELSLIDIKDLPMYDYGYDAEYPAVAREFKDAIASKDGIIIVTPEYSRSIPGALKNALDWAARPYGTSALSGKPTAITGAAHGAIGTAAAQQHLRAILGHMNALVMGQPEAFLRFNPENFDETGEVVDEGFAAVLRGFLGAVVAHTEAHAPVPAAA